MLHVLCVSSVLCMSTGPCAEYCLHLSITVWRMKVQHRACKVVKRQYHTYYWDNLSDTTSDFHYAASFSNITMLWFFTHAMAFAETAGQGTVQRMMIMQHFWKPITMNKRLQKKKWNTAQCTVWKKKKKHEPCPFLLCLYKSSQVDRICIGSS